MARRFLGPPTTFILAFSLVSVLSPVVGASAAARPYAFARSSSARQARLDDSRCRRRGGTPTYRRRGIGSRCLNDLLIPAANLPPGLCAKQEHRSTAADESGPDDGPNGADGEEEEQQEEDGFRRLNIAFVTGNAMKAREVDLILAEHGATRGPAPDTSLVELRMLNVDLPEIQEINTEAIAKNKAIQAAQLAGGPCVVEDTSLKFDALGGMPGPFIKWFQEKLKSDGLYKILTDYEDKSATAVCTLAFCPAPHADPVVFTGKTRGTIVAPVEGRGFGWDSIFVPDGEKIPFSCMTTEQKCGLSHRGKAVRQWAEWLGVNKGALWDRQEGRQEIGHKGLNFKSVFAEQ